jgi:hypothetical protein
VVGNQRDVDCGTARELREGLASAIGVDGAWTTDAPFEAVADSSLRDAAQALGVSRSVVPRWRLSRKPLE